MIGCSRGGRPIFLSAFSFIIYFHFVPQLLYLPLNHPINKPGYMNNDNVSIQRKIQLYHTDAAGILFYSKVFDLAFEAFDALLDSAGVSIDYIILESDFLFPYVHAEADYLLPLSVGQLVTIYASVERIGESSCIISYEIFTLEKKKAVSAKTVHVSIDKKTKQKIALPESLRTALKLYVKQSD